MATASCSSFVSAASTLTNFARLGIATQNELPKILRKLLFITEPPHLLENHLNNVRYLKKIFKAHEWITISKVRTNQYSEFDVPLMYKIIRHLNVVPNPTQGWDSNTPPLANELTLGDDIERIRRIRNAIVHRGNTNVEDSELANYFSIFKDIASRFETYLSIKDEEFISNIQNLENCCIDKDAEQQYLGRLQELANNEDEIAISIKAVQKNLACLRLYSK